MATTDAQQLAGMPAPGVMQKATVHLQANARKYVIALAILVLLVIILAITTYYYRRKWKNPSSEQMRVRKLPGASNLDIAGNRSQWFFGSQDAGHGGSVDRDTTLHGASIYHPHIAYGKHRRHRSEGLVAAPSSAPGQCAPGLVSTTYPQDVYDPKTDTWSTKTVTGCVDPTSRGSDGTASQMYPFDDDVDTGLPGQGACPTGRMSTSQAANTWDPAAASETQALAAAGALYPDSPGEDVLQYNIDRAYDPLKATSDEQLTALLHSGMP